MVTVFCDLTECKNNIHKRCMANSIQVIERENNGIEGMDTEILKICVSYADK